MICGTSKNIRITDDILSWIINGVTTKVKKELSVIVQWYSFTIDIWSIEVNDDCLLHWLTELFEKEAVSHAEPLPGSHSVCYAVQVEHWQTASSSDSHMADGNFEDSGCFAYALQLVITEDCNRCSCHLLTNVRALQAFTTCLWSSERLQLTRKTPVDKALTQAGCFNKVE